jgi:hypothetical protein
MSRRDLTLVLPYYENPGMLAEQLRAWASFPETISAHLDVIVVDDGSPTRPAALPPAPVAGVRSFRLLRTDIDIRWNWLFCRNLGVHLARTEWVLLTDMDHVLPAATADFILGVKLDPRKVYRFSRVDAPRPLPYAIDECAPYKPHPNTWLMTRATFDQIGGYDERLSGCYGTDGEFRDRVHRAARSVELRPEVMVRYPREIIADASTVGFTRKDDPVNDQDLRDRRDARDKTKGWRPLRLLQPWREIA